MGRGRGRGSRGGGGFAREGGDLEFLAGEAVAGDAAEVEVVAGVFEDDGVVAGGVGGDGLDLASVEVGLGTDYHDVMV